MDLPVVLKTHVPKCKKCCADIDQLTAVPTPSRKRGCAPRITYHAPTKRQVVGRAGDLARVLPTYLVDIRSHICRMGHHRVYINYHSPLFARRAQCLRRRSGVGSLWLWLLPIIVGWLQFSPNCDSIRLHKAVDKANSIAHIANPSSQPSKAENISRKPAIHLAQSELDAARLDEYSTPPIYNYARFLPWVQSVIAVSDAFGVICERDYHHDPVDPGTEWRDRNSEGGDAITDFQVENYSVPRPGSAYHSRHKWGLGGSALFRMFIASAVALALQWGTTAGAIVIVCLTSAFGEYIVTLSSRIRY